MSSVMGKRLPGFDGIHPPRPDRNDPRVIEMAAPKPPKKRARKSPDAN